MSDYKTYLSKLKVDDLKALVMSLKQHFKFNITKKKKNDFIEYLLICLAESYFEIIKSLFDSSATFIPVQYVYQC